ncbi:MAG: GNAT family protein [Ferruginibacter sp.]|nr:GNAT family protein [Ferruginibacter sp.]
MTKLDPHFTLEVTQGVQLELLSENHASELFALINENRSYLRNWLPWVDGMRSLAQFQAFIKASNTRVASGLEISCVINDNGHLTGRAGIYNIDEEKGYATLGYWIAGSHQGKGVITSSCRALIYYAFEVLQLDEIEIRCATNNERSSAIAERLNFCRTGIIKNGEFFNQRFIDLYVYSLSKTSWQKRPSIPKSKISA